MTSIFEEERNNNFAYTGATTIGSEEQVPNKKPRTSYKDQIPKTNFSIWGTKKETKINFNKFTYSKIQDPQSTQDNDDWKSFLS